MTEQSSGRIWEWFDRERIHARFRAFYELRDRALDREGFRGATPEDLAAFAKEHPVESKQVEALRAQSYISTTTGLVGGLTAGIHSYRINRGPQFFFITAFLASLACAGVADEFSSWVYGTYTFDPFRTEKTLRKFMQKRYPAES